MDQNNPTPVMEVSVSSPLGFQPQAIVEDDPTPEPTEEIDTSPESTEAATVEASGTPPAEPGLPPEPIGPESEPPSSSPQGQERTHASILAEQLQKSGGLPAELEIPADLTGEQLTQVYDKYRASVLERNIGGWYEQKYGQQKMQYLDYLESGGNPEDLTQTLRFNKLEIEGEGDDVVTNRKKLILAMYKDKEIKEERAESLYNTLFESGEDLEEAKTAKSYFDTKIQQKAELLQRQRQVEAQREAEAIEKTNQQILSVIRSRTLGEKELTPQQSQALEAYMFQPAAVIQVPQADGSTVPHQVSQYYKDYQEFHKNPENLVKLARFIQMGGSMGLDEELSQLKTNDSLLDQLNQMAGTGERSTKNAKNAYYNFGTS